MAGWKVLRPFVWQLPGSGESRHMWTQRVRRFVRGESVIAGVLNVGGKVVRGTFGLIGGVVKAIGAARGEVEKGGWRLEMERKRVRGSRVMRSGEKMIVRPHSGDPRYVKEAAKEAFERRARELTGTGELGELVDKQERVGGARGNDKAVASSVNRYLGDALSASRKAAEKERLLEQERYRGGKDAENRLVGAAATDETGVNEEVARRLEKRGSDVSSKGLFGPVTSKMPDFAKQGATALLGVGALVGTVAALPGVMTGTAVFVAGGALLNARVGRVDAETRKMIGRSETGRAQDYVVERQLPREVEIGGNGTMTNTDGRRGGRDGVMEARAYTVGESQPAVLDVPVIGVLLGWLDDVAYIAERFVRAVKRRVGIRSPRKVEGWQLLGTFEAASTLDGAVRR